MKYSGEKINEAGRKLLGANLVNNQKEFDAVLDVLSYWRSEHDVPLNAAFELLQKTALDIDRKAIFARRLKRYASIVKKLHRFSSMNLRNMQDIGGCRAILTNLKKIEQVLRELKHKPEFRWVDGRHRIKDYVAGPKDDGYRSVHIIGNFAGESRAVRRIEVQLRTFIQHYWATALEIVDLFTHQALKSNQGDRDWRLFFQSVSIHFAMMDSIHLFHTSNAATKLTTYRRRLAKDCGLAESAKVVRACCKKLRVIEKLQAFAGSLEVVDDKLAHSKEAGFALLKIDIERKTVETTVFPSDASKLAEAEYTRIESETAKLAGVVVALVSSSAVGGIKEAYPNYFADSTHFINHLKLILYA
ncbi:MAG: RelA/SpoT domain-containing protein [Opitutaceae bacterium]|nr:RelA/SpoT domain-containing protein [Opitutaceae bacterium]